MQNNTDAFPGLLFNPYKVYLRQFGLFLSCSILADVEKNCIVYFAVPLAFAHYHFGHYSFHGLACFESAAQL
jgi:hypothetical protein